MQNTSRKNKVVRILRQNCVCN